MLYRNCFKAVPLVCAIMSSAAATPASSQEFSNIEPFDVDQDGILDSVQFDATLELVSVVSGATGQTASLLSGDEPGESFGWFVMWMGQALNAGDPSILVAAPGATNRAGEMTGAFYLFNAIDGALLWKRVMPGGFRAGMGAVLVPDQDADGRSDILAMTVSRDANGNESTSKSLVISGAKGRIIGLSPLSFYDAIHEAQSHRFIVSRVDLNRNGTADLGDFVESINFFASGHPDGDINADGMVDAADPDTVIQHLHGAGPQPGDVNDALGYAGVSVMSGDVRSAGICGELVDKGLLQPGLVPSKVVFTSPGNSAAWKKSPPGDSCVCPTCTTFSPPAHDLPLGMINGYLNIEAGCPSGMNDVLSDPLVQEILQQSISLCSLAGTIDEPCLGTITVRCKTCKPGQRGYIESYMPPRVTICNNKFSSPMSADDNRRTVNTLIHELTHVSQLCFNPDDFQSSIEHAICHEAAAYCSEPQYLPLCATDIGTCQLACASAYTSYGWWCTDPVAKCEARCLAILSDCHLGFYNP
ncbi:MAG: hypothetical protein AAF108_01740 [Planctomycetota bacterium]